MTTLTLNMALCRSGDTIVHSAWVPALRILDWASSFQLGGMLSRANDSAPRSVCLSVSRISDNVMFRTIACSATYGTVISTEHIASSSRGHPAAAAVHGSSLGCG